ncbi:MAG TPA: hypothetical protein VFW74_19740, partial [Acidimicrobiia bacterium]|nr:hypothetical protein [Acidimicrobiia bacterium]
PSPQQPAAPARPARPVDAPRPAPRMERPAPVPPPRDPLRSRPAPPAPPVPGNGETAALPQTSVAPRRAAMPRDRAPGSSTALPWPWRVLIWVVAVPLGLLIVAVPARWIGVLNGNSFLDVISGTGIGRYVRIFSIAPFAALVIATIAHVSLEQLPEWLARRRALAREAAQLREPAAAGRPGAAPQRVERSARRTS